MLSTIVALSSVVSLVLLSENLNHWTYLLIATTWGSYTYLKKTTSLDAVSGLFLETLFLSAFLTLAIWAFNLTIIQPNESPYQNLLILLAGVVSVTPLLMFSFATNKIPLSATGFLQFILPLTLFSIGIIFYEQTIPKLSLALLMATASILAILLAYDLSTATSLNAKKIRDEKHL
ncbi:RarD protein [Pseudomonas sp. FH1]|nr:RarD protein [Pseudomonas sp. FH1]